MSSLINYLPVLFLLSLGGCMGDQSGKSFGAGILGAVLIFLAGKIMMGKSKTGDPLFFKVAVAMGAIGIVLLLA